MTTPTHAILFQPLLHYWNISIERNSTLYSFLWETTHKLRNHPSRDIRIVTCDTASQHLPTRFHSFSIKLIYLFFQILSHTVLSNYQNYFTKTWTAPSVPKNSMSPITSPFFAPCIHALKSHAELAIKPSSVAITSLFRSASSATLTSLILSFNISDSPSYSF